MVVFYVLIKLVIIMIILGMIVFTSPAGLGVRESIFIFLMQGSIDSIYLLNFIVISRLIYFISDIFILIMGNLIFKNEKKNLLREALMTLTPDEDFSIFVEAFLVAVLFFQMVVRSDDLGAAETCCGCCSTTNFWFSDFCLPMLQPTNSKTPLIFKILWR